MTHSIVKPEVVINVTSNQASQRTLEPVTCGIPWPQGMLHEVDQLVLCDSNNQPCPRQTQIMDRWHDGSVRWLLLDWQASYAEQAKYLVTLENETSKLSSPLITIESNENALLINTGIAQYAMRRGVDSGFLRYTTSTKHSVITELKVVNEHGNRFLPSIDSITLEARGELRTTVLLQGKLIEEKGSTNLADLDIRIHFYAGKCTVKLETTIRNYRKAEHPGGLWDLGNGGSIYVRDTALHLRSEHKETGFEGNISVEPGKEHTFEKSCELYQDSSGGKNWKSSNHVNRNKVVPLTFCGYHLRTDDEETQGLRATPIVQVSSKSLKLGIAVPHFWQNFPLALEASSGELILRLFPQQFADVHEIQGGEQKTHICFLAFGDDQISDQPLEWCRSLSHASLEPEWYAGTAVVPHLTPRATDPHLDYLQLVDAALDGPDTFAIKREIIDQYGWRHFGDIYGDHEAVNHPGPSPLISHYNNQYDAIAGMAFQYMRSADSRWMDELRHLAQHVIDIDIYHTDHDKSAYNHGLFWHTIHYVDAHTGTHRSYPRDGRVPPHGDPVQGGGPANEQNYTTGLILHYFLTGHHQSKEAAIGLAQWVIDMDDGNQTIFRWLCRSDTGLASKSRSPEYHGPGRGAANSIAALLDGHRLTGQQKFLDKAEQLIRRCIHPADNIEKRNLLDAENRWFYTMFLQSLGRYLQYKQELGQIDDKYAYARTSLLNYTRWMARHEYPYLEKPEILEFPTETWAAQDMRKCEIFNLASLYADQPDALRFREKADFFFRYSTSTLLTMPTRTFCRPVVLMLSYGFAHAWFKQHPEAIALRPDGMQDFGQPVVFVPQKAIAIKRAKLIVAAGGLCFCLLLAGIVYWLLS